MIYVGLYLFCKKLHDFEIISFHCVKYGCLLLMILFFEIQSIFFIKLFNNIKTRVHNSMMTNKNTIFFTLVDEVWLLFFFINRLNQMTYQIPIILLNSHEQLRKRFLFFLDFIHNLFVLMGKNDRVKLITQIIGEVLGELIIETYKRRYQSG